MYEQTFTTSEIEQLVAAARRPKFGRPNVGAFTSELVELLGLNRLAVAEHYASAVVAKQLKGRRTLYSRAGVAGQLSKFNGRAVGYPDAPLLTPREVKVLAGAHGVAVTLYAIRWAVWRHANPGHPKARGACPTLPSILVTPTQRRIREGDALEYVEAYKAHVPYSRASHV